MNNTSESFFVSESLRDVLDQHMLIENTMEEKIKEEGALEIVGKFVSLSISSNLMSLEVSPKIAKFLLTNPDMTCAFSFMDEIWLLHAEPILLEQADNEKFKVTLSVEGRK